MIPTYLLLFLFGLHNVRNVLYQLYIWQLREYRFDRMSIHLKSSVGKRWMFGKVAIIKWVTLLVYLLVPEIKFQVWPLVAVYLLESLLVLKEWLRGVKRPVITLKLVVIVLLSMLLVSGTVVIVQPLPLGVLVADKLLPFFITLLIALTSLPARVARALQVRRATKKLRSMPKLIRIGVTGSFGKSSTKEFLAAMLAKKYRVVKTEKSYNTDIGIARTINKSITKQTEVFVAEMGAYKKGEIAAVCRMVGPNIGIVTGINEQHVELFGSLANTRAAKYELIASLPASGLAVFNEDNEYTRLMAKQTKHVPIKVYGTDKANTQITHIIQKKSELSFDLKLNTQTIHCASKILGKHYAHNIAAAATVANYLGVTATDIKNAIAEIDTLPHTLHIAGEYHGATLIDDTFNANPDSVQAALDYLSVYKGKKYLVLTPLIELGVNGERIHQSIGKYAAHVCDQVIMTNSSYLSAVRQGAAKTGKKDFVIVNQGNKALSFLKKTLTQDDVVVFVGKEAASALQALLNKK